MTMYKQMQSTSTATSSQGRARSGGEPATSLWTQCVCAAAWHLEQLALPLVHAVLHPEWVCSQPVQVTTWHGWLGLCQQQVPSPGISCH